MTLYKQPDNPDGPNIESGSRKPADDQYARHKQRAAELQAEKSKAGREIGELPTVADTARKASCARNLKRFLEVYFADAFKLGWSPDHVRVIEKIQRAVLDGGLFALAMPRGSGKTTICERAVVWAALYGHRPFSLLIAADQKKGKGSLGKIKLAFETNELLLADFPECVYPIRKLERIANRAKGQTHHGEPTRIEWGKELIVLPTIPHSLSSGVVIGAGALLSATRGANHTRPDGSVVRPTLVLLDDPQTRQSARSHEQTELREEIVSADVLGLAGPDQRITALMTCTVIEKGDLADRMLTRSLHPDWQGERLRMLVSFPDADAMKLWEEYRELWSDLLNRDAPPEAIRKKLNQFYKKRRSEMDRGAQVTWDARIENGAVSAIQTAMELFYQRGAESFASEFQNDPLGSNEIDEELQPADKLARRINSIDRGQIPLRAKHLTGGIDVHKELLYWMLCWWDDDFSGGILDYGTWPDQGRLQFTLRQASPTIQFVTGVKSPVAAVRKALDILIEKLCTREFLRPDNSALSLDRVVIDANWGRSTNTVYDACRESPHASLLRPAHGKGIKARHKPMSTWQTTTAEKAGHHWIRRTGRRAVQFLTVDVNYWKSFVHDALALEAEEPHSLSLFRAKPHEHRLLAQHLTAEDRKRDECPERTVDVWEIKAGRPDNHWFDTLVGCAVGANEAGKISPPGQSQKTVRKKRLTAEEIRALREARRA